MNPKELNILLIGPLPNMAAGKVGGARVSFSYLYHFLQDKEYSFFHINTKTYDLGWKKILNPFILLLQLFKNIGSCDLVFLNVSQGGTRYLAPLVFFICRVWNKKFVFRPFGGSLKDYYVKYSALQKWIFDHTILKADLFFLQTKTLIDFFTPIGNNIQHLPTSRLEPETKLLTKANQFSKRFVFIGHVKTSKGIDQLLEARTILGEAYQIDIYGPIKETKYDFLQTEANTPYRGVLNKEEVLPTLRQYDVLVLPTFFSGEGYPGVLIEAYSLGIPVIASQWKSIPEIVLDQQTGYLVAPQSTASLVEGIRFFNKENYPQLSSNARKYFTASFDSDQVNKNIIAELVNLTSAK